MGLYHVGGRVELSLQAAPALRLEGSKQLAAALQVRRGQAGARVGCVGTCTCTCTCACTVPAGLGWALRYTALCCAMLRRAASPYRRPLSHAAWHRSTARHAWGEKLAERPMGCRRHYLTFPSPPNSSLFPSPWSQHSKSSRFQRSLSHIRFPPFLSLLGSPR